jgi:hypothetical protein
VEQIEEDPPVDVLGRAARRTPEVIDVDLSQESPSGDLLASPEIGQYSAQRFSFRIKQSR